MVDKNYYNFFSTSIVSTGANRGLIIDLQRQNFHIVPNTFIDVIEFFKKKVSIEDVYEMYNEESKVVMNEYMEFLSSNSLGLTCDSDEFDRFVDMDTTFDFPSYCSNAIVEVCPDTLKHLEKIVNCLEKLLLVNVQFTCFYPIPIEDLKHLLVVTKSIEARGIELILEFSEDLLVFLPKIDEYNFSITSITIHNTKKEILYGKKTTFKLNFLKNKIESFKHCGIVDIKYFNTNKLKVLESLNHNSCLHKKISIDKDGNIKNCPSMSQSFGNIKDTTLEEALNHPDFKKYWNITKDQIDVCKDCEFRHICTDCRAYIEEPDNQYSKPLKCGYNPYTNVWEEWSTNPLKQKAIEYYGMQELVKKDIK